MKLNEVTNFDIQFIWKIYEPYLPSNELKIFMYLIDSETDAESMFGKTSINLVDFFREKIVTITQPLYDPDRV